MAVKSRHLVGARPDDGRVCPVNDVPASWCADCRELTLDPAFARFGENFEIEGHARRVWYAPQSGQCVACGGDIEYEDVIGRDDGESGMVCAKCG